MPEITSHVELLRADDLLVLRFEFVNLRLDSPSAESPRLTRVDSSQQALVIVHFAPQHIAERCFNETVEQRFEPAQIPVPSVLADPSRIVLRVPDSTSSIPLTIDGLLEWTALRTVVSPRALRQPPSPVDAGRFSSPGERETALDLPYGCVLSPDETAAWSHDIAPSMLDVGAGPVQRRRAELWHTRLGTMKDGGIDETTLPAVRVLWAAHLHGTPLSDELPGIGGFDPQIAVPNGLRRAIAYQSSDVRLMQPPLRATRVMLSQLGGWAALSGVWDISPPPALPDNLGWITGWDHVVAMGRDQCVRTADKGFLLPLGHRAARITITERKFHTSATGEATAYLSQRRFIVVQESERRYVTAGKPSPDLPFKTVRIDLVTAELHASDLEFVRTPDGQVFRFPLTGIDWQEQPRHFSMPMIFVPESAAAAAGNYVQRYNASPERVADFGNQTVAFAIDEGVADPSLGGRTALKTASIVFQAIPSAGVPAFRPAMEQAEVRIPAAEHLGATNGSNPITIQYPRNYVLSAGAGDVFAVLKQPLPLGFSASSGGGGLASPGLNIDGLSRTRGAVPNADALDRDEFQNVRIAGLSGRLLGLVDLATVVPPLNGAEQLPMVRAESIAGGQLVTFAWTTPVEPENPPFVSEDSAKPQLTISGQRFQPHRAGSAAWSDTHGTLENFRLILAGVIELQFKSFSFRNVTGSRRDPDDPEPRSHFGAEIAGIEFHGKLRFLADLSRQLQKAGLGPNAGPFVTIDADGATAGVALSIADAMLGAFNLQNLALSASLRLFFAGDKSPTVRFALSSPENPFLATYLGLGGTGHFALETSEAGDIRKLEAGLALAAVAALDLFIARGVVKVAVGINLSITEGDVVIAVYLRLYGCLEILRLVSVSVDFHLRLAYNADANVATGEAGLTITVRVLAFSRSVRLSVKRSFDFKKGITTTLSASLAGEPAYTLTKQEWQDYCGAFA